MSQRPSSLAEQWFIEDSLQSLEGLCPLCRAAFENELRFFAENMREALSVLYLQTRAIRVQAVLSGRTNLAHTMDNWEALRVHRTLAAITGMAATVLFEQQPHLLKSHSRTNAKSPAPAEAGAG